MLDLSDIDHLKEYLSRYGLLAKKCLAQNFLVDPNILDQILEAAELKHSDRVIEVGAGPGVLSQRLAPRISELVSLEIDERMINPWLDLMKGFNNVEIYNTDVLEYTPKDRPYKLVANIPYYITSPILNHFLRNQETRRPDVIVFLIQKEMAQRICNLKKPTFLSWEIRLFGDPELVCIVPSTSFFPAPKVDSAILRIRIFEEPLIDQTSLPSFFAFLSLAYKQPRKTLLNNLIVLGRWEKELLLDFFQQAGIGSDRRAHQLSFDEWQSLISLTGF